MAPRIVSNYQKHLFVSRPIPRLCAIALALSAAGAVHASTFCLPGNGSSGSYDTLRTGTDVLVYPASTAGSNGSNNGNTPLIVGSDNGVTATNADQSAGGYVTQGWSGSQGGYGIGTLAAAGVSNPVISFAQSASGSGAANTCQNGGANASNTLATVGQVNAAVAAASGAGSNAVQYDTDSSGNKLNSVTLQGGTAGAVTVTNVAAGNVGAASTDAVNSSQLYNTNQNVSTAQSTANTATSNAAAAQTTANNAVTSTHGLVAALGGGAAVGANGAVTAPAYTVQGGTYSDVGSAPGLLGSRIPTSALTQSFKVHRVPVQLNGDILNVRSA